MKHKLPVKMKEAQALQILLSHFEPKEYEEALDQMFEASVRDEHLCNPETLPGIMIRKQLLGEFFKVLAH
ncbi:hypothetical protein ACH3O9_11300 [Leeuwenhoekiella sp. A16]|uniref:hypothetical protein n=1 Tax=Leeuwenhoekiella sp. A16 TaxID=3141462 RepID=UPI003A813D8A